jgi:hypothetical protein
VEVENERDFSFDVMAPSGRRLLPKLPADDRNTPEFKRISRPVNPGSAIEFRIDLGSIYEFAEQGEYRIVARRDVLDRKAGKCRVVSNEIRVSISK